jgi:predicted esterase
MTGKSGKIMMKTLMRPRRIAFATIAVMLGVLGQSVRAPAQGAGTFDQGKVIPRVVSLSDSRHTYALYLPSGYSTERKWPVLFAFDPGARGNIPVERFQDAAEKYGYIVMGSNNSRNGPVQVELEAMRALYTDARQRFSIDEKRLYSAGFSGAARVACQMGLRLRGFAGAIIGGGGFPLDEKPSADVGFVLYGIAGEADLNFNEMLRLHRDFTRLGISNHFEVLPGGHQWPSSEVLKEGVEWMELQAMRSGRRERDPAWIASNLAERLEKAKALEDKGDLVAASRRFEGISKDFRGLADLNEAEAELARLKARPELAKALKEAARREKRMEDRDEEQSGRVMDVIHAIFATGGMTYLEGRVEQGSAPGSAPPGTGPGRDELPASRGAQGGEPQDAMAVEKMVAGLGINSLKSTIEKKPGTDEAVLAERQRTRIFISTFETARMLIEMKKYAQAVMCLEITAKAAPPENAFVDVQLARAQALNKKRPEALKALTSAASKGFDRPEVIEKDEAFEPLRSTPEYAAALEKIRATAAR